MNALFAVPIVLAVVNFPVSVELIRTVPAPRSPIIEIPLLESEIAVIKSGDVALSEYVAIREPAEEIFHKVTLFNSLRNAGTCSTTTPSTLTGLLVALVVSSATSAAVSPANQIFPSLSQAAAMAI